MISTVSITIGYAVTPVPPVVETLERGHVQFTVYAYAVSPAVGTVTLSVSRSGGSDGTASVDYRTAGISAVAGVDYDDTAGTLNWADGDSAPKDIVVPILSVSDVYDRTFRVLLEDASGAAIGAPSTASVTIRHVTLPVPQEPAGTQHGMVQFGVFAYIVPEAIGSLSVLVYRIGGTDGALSVDYETLPLNATEGTDYTGVSGTLNWTDGSATPKVISIPITSDAEDDSNEQFLVVLSNLSAGSFGNPHIVTVDIVDAGLLTPLSHRLDSTFWHLDSTAYTLDVTS